MEYYTTLLAIIRPLQQGDADSPEAEAAVAPDMAMDSTPQEIILRAKNHLETLLRLYCIRHSFQSHHPFLILFLTFFGGEAANNLASNLGREAGVRQLQTHRAPCGCFASKGSMTRA